MSRRNLAITAIPYSVASIFVEKNKDVVIAKRPFDGWASNAMSVSSLHGQ